MAYILHCITISQLGENKVKGGRVQQNIHNRAYTRIHLSPWLMLFRSHINIYRFWLIFFTYSLYFFIFRRLLNQVCLLAVK